MKSYIITLDPKATDTEVLQLKDDIVDQGGEIVHEYALFKGFSCKIPETHFSTFASSPHVKSMEPDGVVTTQ